MVRIVKYQKVNQSAPDLETAKTMVKRQFAMQGQHFVEIVDVEDVVIVEEPKPELLMENKGETNEQK